ncbi:hypothetical protein EVAR_71288_1 [Eumeta japonica]|uniref:Uncharacterized protein n=1 Tax=Eumeta variegata TaxID=151549 RepID=A0A4C2A1X8_EUMVA|nr:hypothetical protein EVAR_71288_1 [Eumeta japonica]
MNKKKQTKAPLWRDSVWAVDTLLDLNTHKHSTRVRLLDQSKNSVTTAKLYCPWRKVLMELMAKWLKRHYKDQALEFGAKGADDYCGEYDMES